MWKTVTVLACLHLCITWSAFAENPAVRVGVILPLTGNAAEYGVAAQNGMTLAQESSPTLFEGVQLIFEDSRHEARGELTALQSLQALDDVRVMVSWGVGPTQVVAPVTQKAGVPLIAITADGAVAKGRSNVVRFNYSSRRYARHLMEYLTQCRYRRIGIVKAEIPYFESIVGGMKAAAGPGQVVEVAAVLPPSETDFRSIIPALRGKGYDAIGVFLVTGQIAKFYQQAGQFKYVAPFFGTDFFESRAEVAEAGSAIFGSVYPSMDIDPSFVERYVARFGNDLQVSYAGNAFDVAMLVGKAIQESEKPLDTNMLIAQMTRAPVDGVSGQYHFDSSADEPGFNPKLVTKRIDAEAIRVIPSGQCAPPINANS